MAEIRPRLFDASLQLRHLLARELGHVLPPPLPPAPSTPPRTRARAALAAPPPALVISEGVGTLAPHSVAPLPTFILCDASLPVFSGEEKMALVYVATR